MKIIFFLQGVIFLLSITTYIFLLFCNFKKILIFFKKIPYLLLFSNSLMFLYKLFIIPHVNSSRGDMGIWILGMAKSKTFSETLMDDRSPVYFFAIKVLSFLFNGITYDFIVNLNLFLCFINGFAIYHIVCFIFKNKNAAIFSSLFYIFSPIIFIFSLNEDYTNPAIFFAIQGFLFVSMYLFYKKNTSFLILSVCSIFLSVGSRPEYIVIMFIYILFLSFDFLKNRKKMLIILAVLIHLSIPRVMVVAQNYTSSIKYDPWIHATYTNVNGLSESLISHFNIFTDNFSKNVLAVTGFQTLMGVLVLFAMMTLFYEREKINYRYIIFFALYYVIFWTYYSYLHNEGVYESYKYISSLIFPLVVLAGLGTSVIFKKNKYFTVLVLVVIFSYSVLSTSTIREYLFTRVIVNYDRYNFEDEFYDKEYGLIKKNKNSIDYNDSVFISHGIYTTFYAALPVRGESIFPVITKDDFIYAIDENHEAANIYISQGVWGFGDLSPDYHGVSDVDWFEDFVMDNFNIEEEIISYLSNGNHHVFLYRVSLKK